MATHYSEMDFLFSNITNRDSVNSNLANADNKFNIFDTDGTKYVVYKSKDGSGSGTNNIKRYLTDKVYKNENKATNPYIQLIYDFNQTKGNPGAGLRIKAADLAYLRELGVYPINRMAILRRFPEGCFVLEDLNEMKIEPISTVIGWIKHTDNFGKIQFGETWTTMDRRFDQVLNDIIKKAMGGAEGTPLVPIGDFAQGMLFELYNRAHLLDKSGVDETTDETYENFDPNAFLHPIDNSLTNTDTGGKGSATSNSWGLNNIPVGNPNLLRQGPWRDPESQNLTSDFTFELETNYEQKLLGDVDPGSAMLDIMDNLMTMGTSNMVFYWGDNSPIIKSARDASSGKGNNLNAWWDMVAKVLVGFWEVITKFFTDTYQTMKKNFETATSSDAKTEQSNKDRTAEETRLKKEVENAKPNEKAAKQAALDKFYQDGTSSKKESGINAAKQKLDDAVDFIAPFLQSILTSTLSINRFKLRGSLELMVGGKISSTPWYLTLGNPYSPWFASNHIIVSNCSIETSNEMGFNDQPQRLKATFGCRFSRPLGKQELMRMFNNTFRRTYNTPPPGTEAIDSNIEKNRKANEDIQKLTIPYTQKFSTGTPQVGNYPSSNYKLGGK